jgi:hypothetical protein
VLESLLRRAQSSTEESAALDATMRQLNHRIFLTGGMRVDVSAAARRRAERERATQTARDALAEIDAIGVRVQDLTTGVLDFPSIAEGRTILLCWKLGEPAILHWHAEDEGAHQRRPVDTLSGNGQSSRPN